jgi:hypothetical protein
MERERRQNRHDGCDVHGRTSTREGLQPRITELHQARGASERLTPPPLGLRASEQVQAAVTPAVRLCRGDGAPERGDRVAPRCRRAVVLPALDLPGERPRHGEVS